MSKSQCEHISKEEYYCKICSRTKVTVYFHNQKSAETGKIKPKYFYSALKYDKVGEWKGIEGLKKMLYSKNFIGKWKTALFYSNPEGLELEKLP